MPNTHHTDPGKPDHPEPERPDLSEPEGWGFDPLVTNPFRPGEDLAALKTQARDVFVLPEPTVSNAPNPPPELQAFTQAVTRIQEPFNAGKTAEETGTQQKWDAQKELARSYKACLPDYWKDAVTFMQDHVAQTADDDNRKEDQAKLKDVLKNRDDTLEIISQWDKERRKYPYDWATLTKLQTALNVELSGYLYRLKQIEEGTLTTNLGTAIVTGQLCFSALGFELGRQGAELTNSATIYYGSASEVAATALAGTTHQNDLVQTLSSSSAKKWWSELSLPMTFGEANPTRKRWEIEVVEPLKEKVSDWLNASKEEPKGKEGYDELKSAAQNLLIESFTQRDSLANREIKNIPDSVTNRARDVLSLLSDAMLNRLNELRENADLTQGKMLRDLIKDIRTLRENTTTELQAKEAADQGLSEFWSGSKDKILDEIKSNFPEGKDLKGMLEDAFKAGLGDLLDAWSAEMKKVPKHSANALHDATWNIRFAIRRYRDSVKNILAAAAYQGPRLQLLASLDALQIAASNRLRQAYQDGYYLF
jgi:hypothetical protein